MEFKKKNRNFFKPTIYGITKKNYYKFKDKKFRSEYLIQLQINLDILIQIQNTQNKGQIYEIFFCLEKDLKKN